MGEFVEGIKYTLKCTSNGEKIIRDYMRSHGIPDDKRDNVHSYMSRSFKIGTVFGEVVPFVSVLGSMGLYVIYNYTSLLK